MRKYLQQIGMSTELFSRGAVWTNLINKWGYWL